MGAVFTKSSWPIMMVVIADLPALSGCRTRTLFFVRVVAAAGCSDDGGVDLDDYDARCVAACTDDPPSVSGAGDVCDTASRQACLDTCTARIEGVATVCATCLLEDACFDPDGCRGEDGGGDECSSSVCTRTGREGSCTYPPNDTAARDACERQVNPRREVACTAEFEPVSQCASSCPAT